MGAIGILLALLIPAIAPIAGYLLGKATKEELKAGRKYFISMQHVLFVAIAAIFLYSNKWDWYIVVLGIAAVFSYISFKQARNIFAIEALFGIVFALAVRTNNIFILSALIFLYGLPTGSLFVNKKKGLYKAIASGLIFAVVAYAMSFFL